MRRSISARTKWFVLAASGGALALACVQFGGLYRPVPETICHSEEIWTYQDKDSPLMNPGRPCIQCHIDEDDEFHAPIFPVAGTVMVHEHEADDCRGAAQQMVLIVDADGEEYELPTNTAGNFWIDAGVEIAFPIDVTITAADGTVSQKQTPVMSGDCGSCHTQQGENGATGRVVRPGTEPSGMGGADAN